MTARTKVALWAGLMMVLWAPAALAQESECAADSDCEAGFVCDVVGGGACPTIACAPGEECVAPDCNPEEIMGCVPGPCDSDADCGDNQVCYKETYESCSAGGSAGCSRDGECAEPVPAEEPTCTTEEFSQCIPRWAAPCEVAADCGPGFTCEPIEECVCSGSASTDAPCVQGEACPTPEPAPEPVCECTPTDTNYCKLIETPCAEDSECGEGMVCVDAGGGDVACAGTDSAGGSDPGGEVPADGGAAEPDLSCEPVAAEPEMLCVPADYETFGFSANDVARGEVTAALGGIAEDGNAATGGDDKGGGAQGPTDEDGAEADGSGDTAAEDDGCSVTSARGATSQGLWLLLAAALLARRRRS